MSINHVAPLFGPEDVTKGESFSDASQRLSQWVGRWRGPPWINWLCGSRIPQFPRTPVSGWGTGQQPKWPTYSGGGAARISSTSQHHSCVLHEWAGDLILPLPPPPLSVLGGCKEKAGKPAPLLARSLPASESCLNLLAQGPQVCAVGSPLAESPSPLPFQGAARWLTHSEMVVGAGVCS